MNTLCDSFRMDEWQGHLDILSQFTKGALYPIIGTTDLETDFSQVFRNDNYDQLQIYSTSGDFSLVGTPFCPHQIHKPFCQHCLIINSVIQSNDTVSSVSTRSTIGLSDGEISNGCKSTYTTSNSSSPLHRSSISTPSSFDYVPFGRTTSHGVIDQSDMVVIWEPVLQTMAQDSVEVSQSRHTRQQKKPRKARKGPLVADISNVSKGAPKKWERSRSLLLGPKKMTDECIYLRELKKTQGLTWEQVIIAYKNYWQEKGIAIKEGKKFKESLGMKLGRGIAESHVWSEDEDNKLLMAVQASQTNLMTSSKKKLWARVIDELKKEEVFKKGDMNAHGCIWRYKQLKVLQSHKSESKYKSIRSM